MNIRVIYIAGGTGIYAAIAFHEYIASVAAGFIYSATMKNGITFGLASASIFGICVFALNTENQIQNPKIY